MTLLDTWLADAARAREEAGLTRSTRVVPDLLDLAGNDYLALRTDPRVVEGALRATREHGAGAGASRLVTGTHPVHVELEQALTALTGTPAALVLSTGYHANLAAMTALTDADTLIVSDAHVHASLIDGARLSRADVVVARHGDVEHVDQLLAARTQTRAVVVVESVYSVLGDAADLPWLHAVCRRHGATLLVDEAHGIGVLGERGEGGVAAAGLAGASDVVVTLTLSKTLGAQGGAVLGSAAVREHLVNTARPFIYDTGLAPGAAGGALAALRVMAQEPQRVARVHAVAAAIAVACGVDAPAGAVLSVPMPGPRETVAAVARAEAEGVRIGAFRPPSTPDGSSRLRLTASAGLTDDDLARASALLTELTAPTVSMAPDKLTELTMETR